MSNITDTLWTSPVNPLYTVSQDPGDNSFCVWRGDSYVMAFDTLKRAIEYAENFVKVNKGQ